jgi:chromosome condensin MukBEF MukE localization factor
MINEEITNIEALVTHKNFGTACLHLLRGFRVDQTHALYPLISDNIQLFNEFYEGFGGRVINAPENYCYLVSEQKLIRTKTLDPVPMFVGMVLCSLRLSPAIVSKNYTVTLEEIRQSVESCLNPEKVKMLIGRKASRMTDMAAARDLSKRIDKALKTFKRLGFIKKIGDEYYLPGTLASFMGPARTGTDLLSYLKNHGMEMSAATHKTEEEMNG